MIAPKSAIDQLLLRGGKLTIAEVNALSAQLTASKLQELQQGALDDSIDQPVKIIARDGAPLPAVSGFFTQEKFLLNHTPRELEVIMGMLGKLKSGAYVLTPAAPLIPADYENRAYSHLPGGKPFEDPAEPVYRPGKGAPQWALIRKLPARILAELAPDEKYVRLHTPLDQMTVRVAELDKNVSSKDASAKLNGHASPLGGARGMVRSSGQKGHAGWDLYANIGWPAYACTWGVVEAALNTAGKSRDSYGNYVAIRLLSREAMALARAQGVKSIYAFYGHLSAVRVKAGDPVWQGRIIGLTGHSGNAYNTPPHLHFELRTAMVWEKGHPLKNTIDPGELFGYRYYATRANQTRDPYSPRAD